MAARVPGVEGEIWQIKFVDQMRHAPAMLMAAMEKKECAARFVRLRRPPPIEQLHPVMGGEGEFVMGAGQRAFPKKKRAEEPALD